MGTPKTNTQDRFVLKTKKAANGCVEFTGRLNKDGYGQFSLDRRTPVAAHRLSFFFFVGLADSGLCVLHSCDNPRCVNPIHLFLGTQKSNIADKVSKGRQAMGEGHGAAKLTNDEVRSIRERYASRSRGTVIALSREFGIDRHGITRIGQGKAWKHI